LETVLILRKNDSFFFYKTRVPLARNETHAKNNRHPSEVLFILFNTISCGLIHIDASWKRLQKCNHLLGA